MNIEHIGHAGFIVEVAGKRVLIDPWFNPAFQNSWIPNPDNGCFRERILAGRFDYLYISHAHEDHFDRRFLGDLPKTKVICPPFERLRHELLDLGFRIVDEVSEGSLSLKVFVDEAKEDSALLIDDGAEQFLDLNDCQLAEYPKANTLTCQFSSASWYPACYEYNPWIMEQKVREVCVQLIESLARKINLTGATRYIPSAGPPTFVGPRARELNANPVFGDWMTFQFDVWPLCPNLKKIGPWLSSEDHPTSFVERKFGHTTFSVPTDMMAKIDSGEVGWEAALLSMRIRIKRDPDVYDAELFSRLRHGHGLAKNDETFARADGSIQQRYCPHEGQDLVGVVACDGVIECPKHHWRFDAATGKCLSGGNIDLKVSKP